MGLKVSEYIVVTLGAAAGSLSINVSESITVQDAKYTSPHTVTPSISVYESVSASEQITAKLAQYNISVSEAVGIRDSPTVHEPNYYISKSEAVGVVDSPSARLAQYLVSVSDAVAVTDAPTVALGAIADGSISVNQAVGVTDVATVQLDRYNISVSEAVGVTEYPTAQEPDYYISKSEAVAVSDAAPSVSVVSAATLTVSTSEAVAVLDVPTAQEPFLTVSKSEAVAVTDSLANLNLTPLSVSAFERVAVAESGITVTIESSSTLAISKFESVGVTESTALLQPSLPVSVAEAVGVADAVANIRLTPLAVSVFERVAVVDVPTVGMGAAGDLNVSKFEAVTVRENITATVPFLVVSASEVVGVTDATTGILLRQFNVQVSEVVGVRDAVADIGPFPGGVIAISVTERVAVSTSVAVGHETAERFDIRKPGRFAMKETDVTFRIVKPPAFEV